MLKNQDQHICAKCNTAYPEGDHWKVVEAYPGQFYHNCPVESLIARTGESTLTEDGIAAMLLGTVIDSDVNQDASEKELTMDDEYKKEADCKDKVTELEPEQDAEEDDNDSNQKEGHGNDNDEGCNGSEPEEDDKEMCTCGGLRVGSCIQQSSSSFCRFYTTILVGLLLVWAVGWRDYRAGDDYCASLPL